MTRIRHEIEEIIFEYPELTNDVTSDDNADVRAVVPLSENDAEQKLNIFRIGKVK